MKRTEFGFSPEAGSVACLFRQQPNGFMSALTTSIDYGNFKSAIAASPTRPKLSAYHDIHHRMVEWQQLQFSN